MKLILSSISPVLVNKLNKLIIELGEISKSESSPLDILITNSIFS